MLLKNVFNRIRNLYRGPQVTERMKRLLTSGELQPIPNGWEPMPPDFVGVACPKAGTSWWYQLLLDHPQVVPNRTNRKELHFFEHFTYRGIKDYHIETYYEVFARPPSMCCGEWTPSYLTYPFALNYLAEAAPDAKILVIVRNPVDRVASTLNQLVTYHAGYLNLKRERAYFFQTYSLFPEAILKCLVYQPFRRLLTLFERSQLLVLQYEQCRRDPLGEIKKTYRFLDIDDSHVPAHLDRKIHQIPYIVDKPNKREREMLTDFFSNDVYELISLFPDELDLSLWPDFC